MAPSVVRCDQAWEARWNAYVDSRPASFYHRFEWLAVNRDCFGHRSAFLAAVDDDRIVGILPIVQVRSRLFGNIACSMPFVNYGGPCADSLEIERELLDGAMRVGDEWNVDHLELRARHNLGEHVPLSDHKVSVTLTLNRDPDVLWKAFKTGHRQDVRKGYSNGFVAKFGTTELLDDFYRVLSESWRDLGTPVYAKSYFAKLVDTFGDRVRICVLYHEGAPIAAAFDGHHGGIVEGMWLGTRAEYRNRHAGYVLYWELIKDACERGFDRFHLGRSTAGSGAETFKRKWNAQSEQLYWHYLLRRTQEIPKLNVDNPKYRFAIHTWQKLPVTVTQRVGPYLARCIP